MMIMLNQKGGGQQNVTDFEAKYVTHQRSTI